MTRNMFRDVIDPSIKVGSKRGYTVPLSIVAHAAALVALIVIPLLATDILPAPPTLLSFIIAVPTPTAPPLPRARTLTAAKPLATAADSGAVPLEAPHDVQPEPSVTSVAERSGLFENSSGTIPGAMVGDAVPPPPPPTAPPAPSAPTLPVRPGGEIKEPTKIKDVAPVYPQIAQAGRVEGVVTIEATISPSGNVQDARILRSSPLLDAAALDAVRQWRYTPTLLNGRPVPVLITVTVHFKLR